MTGYAAYIFFFSDEGDILSAFIGVHLWIINYRVGTKNVTTLQKICSVKLESDHNSYRSQAPFGNAVLDAPASSS